MTSAVYVLYFENVSGDRWIDAVLDYEPTWDDLVSLYNSAADIDGEMCLKTEAEETPYGAPKLSWKEDYTEAYFQWQYITVLIKKFEILSR